MYEILYAISENFCDFPWVNFPSGDIKGGSITVPLTSFGLVCFAKNVNCQLSYLTGLESADSKPVK
jgi:hypothetical protein